MWKTKVNNDTCILLKTERSNAKPGGCQWMYINKSIRNWKLVTKKLLLVSDLKKNQIEEKFYQ